MNRARPQLDPEELLRGIHAALDLIERNLNRLPWHSETGSHIDLVVQLRNRIIASYPHAALSAGSSGEGVAPTPSAVLPVSRPDVEEPLSGSGE